MKCPDCGARKFYVKDPDDQYHISEFIVSAGNIEYLESPENEDPIEVHSESEVYCDTCAWHDSLNTLKKNR